MAKTLLLDADSFVYQMAHGHQHAFAWTSELWTYKGDLQGAKLALGEAIDELKEATRCDAVQVALTCTQGNFRKLVVPTYKGNRVPGMRPVLFKPLRDWLREEFNAVVIPWLEGDDVVAMWATADPENTVVCSIDKDLETVPCTLYNPNKPELGLLKIDRTEAYRAFLFQVLMGDRTDGYFGCPGIGPVSASKALKAGEYNWQTVVEVYETAELGELEALENARCAHLLRHGQMKDGQVMLWNPPGRDVSWLKLEPLPNDEVAL